MIYQERVGACPNHYTFRDWISEIRYNHTAPDICRKHSSIRYIALGSAANVLLKGIIDNAAQATKIPVNVLPFILHAPICCWMFLWHS